MKQSQLNEAIEKIKADGINAGVKHTDVKAVAESVDMPYTKKDETLAALVAFYASSDKQDSTDEPGVEPADPDATGPDETQDQEAPEEPKLNKDGLVPGAQVDFDTLKRIQVEHRRKERS